MSIDDQALAVMQSGVVMTPAVGEERWRCLAVHSLIARLRKRGYIIETKMRRNDETGRVWGEYRMVEPIPFAGMVPLC